MYTILLGYYFFCSSHTCIYIVSDRFSIIMQRILREEQEIDTHIDR